MERLWVQVRNSPNRPNHVHHEYGICSIVSSPHKKSRESVRQLFSSSVLPPVLPFLLHQTPQEQSEEATSISLALTIRDLKYQAIMHEPKEKIIIIIFFK